MQMRLGVFRGGMAFKEHVQWTHGQSQKGIRLNVGVGGG